MWNQQYPILLRTGVLMPTYTELDIKGVTNRQGGTLAYGNCVEFDLFRTQAESLSWEPGALASDGSCGSVWGNVIRPVANTLGVLHLACSIFGLVNSPTTGTVADNATCDVRVVGLFATAATVTAAPPAGTCFSATGGAYTLTDATVAAPTNAKVIAIAQAAGSGNVTSVMFNGFGFGHSS